MLLADLLHPTRLNILKLLFEEPKTLAEIKNDLDISKPEVSRHLAKLREMGVVKRLENAHKITNLGENIINIINPIEFLLKHYDYFKNHQIVDLPLSVIRDIDALLDSILISGTGYIFSKVYEIREEENTDVKMMVDQPFPDSKSQKVNNALFIVPTYAKSENLNIEIVKETSNYFEFRTLPKVNYGLGIVDKSHGFIFFPGINGKVDYNFAFYVTDPIGIGFLTRLWSYFWERSNFRISSKTIHSQK